MNMRLIGAPTIKDIAPDMVDASHLGTHVVSVPEDRLYGANCQWNLPCSAIHNSSDLILPTDDSMQSARLRDIKAKL